MNPIRAATLQTEDLDAAVERYQTWLGYEVVERGVLDAGIARSFDAPGAAGADYTVLRPSSGRAIYLRLVQAGPAPGYRPLRTYGWAAIEICIADVHATHARLANGPFEIIGPPAAVSGLPSIHPMQVCGPDGEIIFLTEIKQGGPGSGLPTAMAPVDTLFICVLACRDMLATGAWVRRQLGATVAPEIAIPYKMISRAFSLPPEQLTRIATAERDGHIFLELDQYPAEATERPHRPGELPTGVAVVTLSHDDLDAVEGPWLSPPERRTGAIYKGRRVGVLRAPEGALIELIEA